MEPRLSGPLTSGSVTGRSRVGGTAGEPQPRAGGLACPLLCLGFLQGSPVSWEAFRAGVLSSVALGLGTMLGFELRAGCVPSAERGALLLSPCPDPASGRASGCCSRSPHPLLRRQSRPGVQPGAPNPKHPLLADPCLPPLTVHQASVPLVLSSPWGAYEGTRKPGSQVVFGSWGAVAASAPVGSCRRSWWPSDRRSQPRSQKPGTART